MTTWIDELKSDIEKEFAGKPVVATLATVRLTEQGPQADARSIVVRRISSDGELLIASDSRSKKNHQLKQNPSATTVFWLPKLRTQFRVSGTVKVVFAADDASLRVQKWRELSDSARALFHWPACGEIRRGGDEFAKAISSDSPVPKSFELLLLSPESVETLDLNPHPHLRIKWTLNDGLWRAGTVNP